MEKRRWVQHRPSHDCKTERCSRGEGLTVEEAFMVGRQTAEGVASREQNKEIGYWCPRLLRGHTRRERAGDHGSGQHGGHLDMSGGGIGTPL